MPTHTHKLTVLSQHLHTKAQQTHYSSICTHTHTHKATSTAAPLALSQRQQTKHPHTQAQANKHYCSIHTQTHKQMMSTCGHDCPYACVCVCGNIALVCTYMGGHDCSYVCIMIVHSNTRGHDQAYAHMYAQTWSGLCVHIRVYVCKHVYVTLMAQRLGTKLGHPWQQSGEALHQPCL